MRERGIVVILLTPLVAALLGFFAVAALIPADRSEDLVLSTDGVTWTEGLSEPLMAQSQQWWPGEERTAILYVHNRGPESLDAEVSVTLGDDVVPTGRAEHDPVAVSVQVGDRRQRVAGAARPAVEIGSLAPGQSVPLVLGAEFDRPTSTVAPLDAADLQFEVEVAPAAATDESAQLLSSGAMLWMAPVLVVLGGLAMLVLPRRRRSLRWSR